jgi:hypothetical protein
MICLRFQPFKVCFAIGILNIGGTVAGKFVLIGADLAGSDIFEMKSPL